MPVSPGHIYLLGTENGKVKVGSSRQPHQRIVLHRLSIGRISPIVSEWVSPLHYGHLANERRIVAFMGWVGEIATADYAEVLAFANSLKFPTKQRIDKGSK